MMDERRLERVLIVDDDPEVLDLCEATLDGEGYRLDTAASGEEALRKLEAQPYDVVLTDHVAVRGGGTVANKVKELWPATELLVMSGSFELRSAVAAFDAGAAAYLLKPFEPGRLAKAVRRALERRDQDEAHWIEVMRTLRMMNTTVEHGKLLPLILAAVKKTMKVEASSLMLFDPKRRELYFDTTCGGAEDLSGVRLKEGEGIAGRVVETKRPLIVNDVARSPYHSRVADETTGFKTKQVLCVPLFVGPSVIGVLEAVNKTEGGGFERRDVTLFQSFADQAAIAIENARLFHLAAYDTLTESYRRSYFESWLDVEYARLLGDGRECSLVVIDVDRFKAVNDAFGHPAGDRVLREVAARLRGALPENAALGRWGGEEFAVVLPDLGAERALSAAEGLRRAVGDVPFHLDGKTLRLTISLGVTSEGASGTRTLQQALEDADRALYIAKKSRDAVRVFRS